MRRGGGLQQQQERLADHEHRHLDACVLQQVPHHRERLGCRVGRRGGSYLGRSLSIMRLCLASCCFLLFLSDKPDPVSKACATEFAQLTVYLLERLGIALIVVVQVDGVPQLGNELPATLLVPLRSSFARRRGRKGHELGREQHERVRRDAEARDREGDAVVDQVVSLLREKGMSPLVGATMW